MSRRRLSEQQQRRVRRTQERRRTGRTAPERDLGAPEAGLVIEHRGRETLIESARGITLRARLRSNIEVPVAGDRVSFQRETGAGERAVIVALDGRGSELRRRDGLGRDRVVAANIDQVVVVSAVRPRPRAELLDRYLLAIETLRTQALLVLNKSDLGDAGLRVLEEFRDLGYPLLTTSAHSGDGLEQLRRQLNDRTSVVVGQSGVGKSSLINALLPAESLPTGELSAASGEGRHTTRASRLYHLPSGGALIDSPGVRGFDPIGVMPADVAAGFVEFRPMLGRCRFANCTHVNEPGCALREAAAAGRISARRYQSYLELLSGSEE